MTPRGQGPNTPGRDHRDHRDHGDHPEDASEDRDGRGAEHDGYAAGVKPLPRKPLRMPPPLPLASRTPREQAHSALPVFVWKERDDQLRGARPGHEKVLSQLARGELPEHAMLDLHGRTVAEAERDVSRFFAASRGPQRRAVIVVHGKGTHSPGGRSALREALVLWLTSLPLAEAVLAFATARPNDGGTGALYVLLAPRR